MFETDAELAELQGLLDGPLARANPHMTSIITAERRLTVMQVVRHLTGTRHVALATVNSKGKPRVSNPYTWGDDIVFFRIQPQSMWAYAFDPTAFPE